MNWLEALGFLAGLFNTDQGKFVVVSDNLRIKGNCFSECFFGQFIIANYPLAKNLQQINGGNYKMEGFGLAYLGEARGVICLAAATKNVSLVEYAATRIKKAIVGNGLASKFQMQRMVAQTLGIKELPKFTDVTDALGLAIAHSYIGQK